MNANPSRPRPVPPPDNQSPRDADVAAAERLAHSYLSDVALTPKEAALLLGFKVKSLANWRTAGRGPPFRKINGQVRYMRSSLEAWVNEHAERRSTSERPQTGRPLN